MEFLKIQTEKIEFWKILTEKMEFRNIKTEKMGYCQTLSPSALCFPCPYLVFPVLVSCH